MKKKPPATSSPGDDARRWREGTAAPRDAEIAPMKTFASSTSFLKAAAFAGSRSSSKR